jgi:diguanylate cyclase (GGDEF)-like protein
MGVDRRMTLDVRTLVLLASLVTLLISICLVYAARGYPDSLRNSLWAWAGGTGVQSLGWLLLGLRGQIPDFASIVVANTLVAYGYAEIISALRRFGGNTGRRFWLPHWLALGVAAVCIAYSVEAPDLRARLMIVSALIAVQYLIGLQLVWRLAPPPRPVSHRVMIAMFVVGIAVLSARAIAVYVAPLAGNDPFVLTPLQALSFATGTFGPVVATFAFLLMVSDRMNEELGRLAMFDPLTEVYNRRSLDDLAGRAVAEARRHARTLSVLVVDADHFKRINDEYGHEAGDRALKALVEVLRRTARSEDLVGRLGGEEFVVLMPDADAIAGAAGAERLRIAVERSVFRVNDQTVPLRVSIGVAALRDPRDDFAALLRRADHALYEAKRAGRNRVVLDSVLAEQS